MNHTAHDTMIDTTATFSTEVTGLADATRPDVVALDDGDSYQLRIAPVAKTLGDDRVRMLSYNGSIPGPTLRVRQGSEVVVHVRNDGDTEATVHWHGLRLDNAYDGVPFETQPPIEIGGEFTYRLRFPDAGLYWYHPHIREDYGLDMGLYGNIVVEPADADYWPAVDREVVVTLDDVLVEDGRIAAFHEAGPTHVAMGRFGNVMLTGGETSLTLRAQVGEVVRFYFTNTANTRLFNVALPGARMKLVGGDSGRYEHETFVDEVLLAPSERAIVDVRFDTPGSTPLEHRTPGRTYTLGTVDVTDTATTSSSTRAFEQLRTSDELAGWRARLNDHVARRPDKTLAFKSRMPLLYGDGEATAAAYTCPMHSDVVSTEPGTCPQCGMKLVPAPTTYVCPMHPDVVSTEPGTCPQCGMKLVRADHVRVPDAPRRHFERRRHVPEMRDAARPSHQRERGRARARTRSRPRPRHARWPRMGRPDAGDQRGVERAQHAVATRRRRHRQAELGDRLGVPCRGPRQDPAAQRHGPGPPDAPPVPHSRRGPVPHRCPRRRRRVEPCLEGHRARPLR